MVSGIMVAGIFWCGGGVWPFFSLLLLPCLIGLKGCAAFSPHKRPHWHHKSALLTRLTASRCFGRSLISCPLCLYRPVIVEIPHFGSMRGQERELIILRSENGESWKEHLYDSKTDDLVQLLAGMDEGSTAFPFLSGLNTNQ